MILQLINSQMLQVFSISEFDFCYNYVFHEPFQERMSIILTTPFTFEDGKSRDLCTRTDNVLFREVNQSTFSVKIDSEFDLNSQPFSLFFYVFQNVTIVDTEINMKLSNSSNQDFAFLVATVPEYSIVIRGSTFKFESKSAISSFYGIANNLIELLTVNRSAFTFICSTTISKFYGISSQVNNIVILNSSFSITTSAATSCGFVSLVLGASTFKNLTVSGALSGANTFGFIYENRGACTIQNITYSMVTSGSASNCGFVQLTSGSGVVSTSSIAFVGFASSQMISEPASYSGTCPCITGSSLQSGLCYCATGSLPISNNCSCTTPNAVVVNKVCVCGVNATNSSNVCTCPTGSTLVNGICKCSTTNAFPVSGVCVCGTNATNSSNVCVCPTGSILTNGVCVCQTPNSFPVSGICVCGTNATNSSNSCVCPTGSSLISGVCKCATANAFPVSGAWCLCHLRYQRLEYLHMSDQFDSFFWSLRMPAAIFFYGFWSLYLYPNWKHDGRKHLYLPATCYYICNNVHLRCWRVFVRKFLRLQHRLQLELGVFWKCLVHERQFVLHKVRSQNGEQLRLFGWLISHVFIVWNHSFGLISIQFIFNQNIIGLYIRQYQGLQFCPNYRIFCFRVEME
ncbi:Conserved_hypothetical protein [Hexamita inflata]|uniref:Uncharacterized protein n=1 Tax=Hexamita inflata TaxID=28002 RepID=A0AA86P7M8_9EUKA|nr:Conserved hypothetical protein [Hexamita inflata]